MLPNCIYPTNVRLCATVAIWRLSDSHKVQRCHATQAGFALTPLYIDAICMLDNSLRRLLSTIKITSDETYCRQWPVWFYHGFPCYLINSTIFGEKKYTVYTGCNRRNVRDFGRVFLRSHYTDITQNAYIQSSMVTEILAREVWNFDSYYSLIDYQIHIETGRNMWFL